MILNKACFIFGEDFGLYPPCLTAEIIGNIYENPEFLNQYHSATPMLDALAKAIREMPNKY